MTSIVVGTAGHIDHGKSALVRALTGTDPDRLKEEQERGITIDLGFAHWAAGDASIAFVDVPGHERFVRNMLAGVGGIDAVLLLVAADESVMPQTREHFEICRLLRIPTGIVVLSKADLVDAETIELVRLEVRDLVAGSFLERAPVLSVSARTGEGLPELREALLAQARLARRRSTGGPVRLPVDRVFTVKGFGTVVTGTLVAGAIALEDVLQALPSGRDVKVRGIQMHGRGQQRADAGNRVAINLGGVEVGDLHRGETLIAPGTLESTRVIDLTVEVVPGARPLRHGARVRFHQGTGELLGRLAVAGAAGADRDNSPATGRAGREDGAASTPGEIPPGTRAYGRLRLESPAVVTRGDRFILRAYSPPMTIAGGLVLDPHPPRAGIRRAGSRVRFEHLDPDARPAGTPAADPDERALVHVLGESGAAGLPASALTSRLGIAPADIGPLSDRLVSAGLAARVGECLVAAPALRILEKKLLAMVSDHHKAQPLSEGVPREEARERLFAGAGPGVFERVLADLAASGRIVARDRLALATYRMALSADEERARARIEARFREAGLKPPDEASLAQAVGVAPALADRMVKLLVRQKVLARVENLVFHEDALAQLKRDVAAMKAATAGTPATIDVATFKERYAVTRKFAIPLLEYLDRERVTRRAGDVRVIV